MYKSIEVKKEQETDLAYFDSSKSNQLARISYSVSKCAKYLSGKLYKNNKFLHSTLGWSFFFVQFYLIRVLNICDLSFNETKTQFTLFLYE